MQLFLKVTLVLYLRSSMRWIGILPSFFLLWAQEESRVIRAPEPALVRAFVEGRVVDQKTGEGLAGATVWLGREGRVADLQGRFQIPFTQSGDTMRVSFPEYRTKKIVIKGPGIVVVSLEPFEAELEAVEIVSEVGRETEAAVALERLRSLEIGESYTAEQIMKRTTDFYVPNVLRRLPGVSLLSGRWVSLRGLGERYNAFAFWAAYPTWLRYDASMPAINEIVSTLLGRVEIRKVWTPELLGHFGGGMIDFQLPEGGEKGFSVALTGEMGSWGLGQPYPTVRGNWNRWANTDLPDPAILQATAPQDRPLPENFSYARQYRRFVDPDSGAFAPPGPLLTLSYNHTTKRLQTAFRFIYGMRYNWSRMRSSDGTFDSTDGAWHYEEYLSSEVRPVWHLSQNTGFSSTLTYALSERQRLSLSLLGLDLKTQRYGLEQGIYYSEDLGAFVTSWYPSHLLEQSQLGMVRLRHNYRGTAWLTNIEGGLIGQRYHVPYSGAMNYIIYPGDSVFRYEKELWGASEIYALTWHSRSRGWQGYFHPSIERRWGTSQKWVSVRIGAWYSYEALQNHARTLGLMPDTTHPSILTPEILAWDRRASVYEDAYRVPGGFWLLDRTGDFHRWRGGTQIAAGYGMIRVGYEVWDVMVGARYEAFDRQLFHLPVGEEGYKSFLVERRGDVLPSVIGKYRLSEFSHLKAAVYRTLIRPPVPAQVPTPYFDYLWAFYWSGDPGYRTGSAWNADLRWEKIRGPYRLWGVGLFYKALHSLPEVYLEPASYTEVFTFKTRNRSYGEVAGIEVEIREILWGDEAQPRLWMYFNATLSESGSRFWRGLTDPYNERLQGQAPYVVNAGVISRPASAWEVSTFFNYTGPQIWAMGFDPNVYPHIIEGGRAFWEWQVSRRFGRWEVRLNVWDVLNQPYRRIQKVGNASRPFDEARDAQPVWQREEWRFYLTVRWQVF